MEDNKNLFVEFKNTEETPLKLPSIKEQFPGIPSFYLDNILENPYSNKSLGLPDGTGYLDLLEIVSDIPNKTKNKPINNSGDVRSYVKNWFIHNAGLSDIQASALTGVLYAESRLKPSIHEIGKESNPYAGLGLPQWTGQQRQQHARDLYKLIFNNAKSIKEMSLDEQLNVIIAEFKERKGNWDAFRNAKTLEEATDIVWRGYENGGINTLASMSQMNLIYGNRAQKLIKERILFANEIYKL